MDVHGAVRAPVAIRWRLLGTAFRTEDCETGACINMNRKEIFSIVDHTLLKQTATFEQIRQLCDEAI